MRKTVNFCDVFVDNEVCVKNGILVYGMYMLLFMYNNVQIFSE